MKDYKRDFLTEDRRDAKRSRMLFAVIVFFILALIKAGFSYAELKQDRDALRVELVEVLAVSDDASKYMRAEGHGLIFTDMDMQ